MTRIFVLTAILSLAASTSAMAGSPYVYPLTGQRVANPAASGVPNVPDLQGCVKWCVRDQNPCDPSIFKRADGRCNYFD